MRAPRPALVAAVVAVAVAALLAGCTGVPNSSRPETVEKGLLGRNGTDQPSAPTVPNTTPRSLVQAFLNANVNDAAGVPATAFLTPTARNSWSDTKGVTIVAGETFGPPVPSGSTVRVSVTGREVGSLDATGVYTPSPQGVGDGGSAVTFTYSVQQVHGVNRISSLQPGLVVTSDQFLASFRQQSLYFYDNAGRYLVQDPRWTALSGDALATWLLQQLVAGPSPDLQTAVTSAPVRAGTRRLSVRLGPPATVEIPGSAALPAAARDQLAAEVSQTLQTALRTDTLTITDSGAKVSIPRTRSTRFDATTFAAAAAGPTPPMSELYYLRAGRMVSMQGKLVSGPLGSGEYNLSSIALGRPVRGQLSVAGVTAAGTGSQLEVGTESAGLRPVKGVVGRLSRPSWAPARNEVWIADGPALYRVTISGKSAHAARVTTPATSGGGRIAAVRVAPDGSRIAVVIQGANGVGQLYVGAIVREAGQVRIDKLDPISPGGTAITDVGWVGSLRLYAIGTNTGSPDPRLFETSIDGSEWTAYEITGLTGAPISLTSSASALAWLSDSSGVWIQHTPNFTSAGPDSLTPGSAPAYVE